MAYLFGMIVRCFNGTRWTRGLILYTWLRLVQCQPTRLLFRPCSITTSTTYLRFINMISYFYQILIVISNIYLIHIAIFRRDSSPLTSMVLRTFLIMCPKRSLLFFCRLAGLLPSFPSALPLLSHLSEFPGFGI